MKICLVSSKLSQLLVIIISILIVLFTLKIGLDIYSWLIANYSPHIPINLQLQ